MASKIEMYRPLTESELLGNASGAKSVELLKENPWFIPAVDEEGVRYLPFHQSMVVDPFYLSMGELVESLSVEVFKQLPVYNPKGILNVSKILLSLVKSETLISDIEVGYLATQLTDGGEIADGELPVVVSGRHRLVALLTGYALSKVKATSEDFKGMLIRVSGKVFSTQKDMLDYIVSQNSSRSMSVTEKKNIGVGSLGYDTDNIESIIRYALDSKGTTRFVDVARLSFVYFAAHQSGKTPYAKLPAKFAAGAENALEYHTAGQVGAAFGTSFKSLDGFKKLLHTDERFIAKALMHAWGEFCEYLASTTETWIARNARSIGAEVSEATATELESSIPVEEEVVEEAPKVSRKAKGEAVEVAPQPPKRTRGKKSELVSEQPEENVIPISKGRKKAAQVVEPPSPEETPVVRGRGRKRATN